MDTAVFGKLKQLGIPASEICDDATFLRRVSLDITGALPTDKEVQSFLADASHDRRDRLIDRLLDSPAYADQFSNKWNFVLRNHKVNGEDTPGTMLFHQWLWDKMYDNTPYDKFVREIITATGDPQINPAVTWYRDVDSTEEQVEDTAQLFLGLRIQCARCHHHPFEKWSQDDYYGMAAFYGQVGKKTIPNASAGLRDRRVFHNEGVATASNPRSGKALKPAGMQFDIGNHWKYGSMGDWIRQLGKRVMKLDIKGYSRANNDWARISEGDIDYADVRKALREINFYGWVAAEVGGGNAAELKHIAQELDMVFGLV